MADQSTDPISAQQAPQRQLPGWVFALVIAVCLASGTGFVWWFFSSSPAKRVEVVSLQPEQRDPALRPEPVSLQRDTPARPTERGGAPSYEIALPPGTMPPPLLINANWRQAPLNEVLDELSRHTGMPIRIQGRFDPPTITLQAENQPFWDVFCQVLRQAGLEMAESSQSELHLRRGDRVDADPPTLIHGPLMITLQRVMHTAILNPRDNTIRHELSVTFTAAAYPSEHLVGIVPYPSILQAADQRGNDMDYKARPYPYMTDMHRTPFSMFGTQLQYLDGAERIDPFAAYISVITCDRMVTMEIDNPLEARPRRLQLEDVAVSFEQLTEEDRSYVLRLAVDRARNMSDPHLQFRFSRNSRAVQLLDADGRAFRSFSGIPNEFRDGIATIRYRFDRRSQPNSLPAKLVLTIPEGMKETRIPFQFSIPVPQ